MTRRDLPPHRRTVRLLVFSDELVDVESAGVHLALVVGFSDGAEELGELRDVFVEEDFEVVLREEKKVSCDEGEAEERGGKRT